MNKNFLQGIDTVIMRVSDIQKSIEWYTQKLGLKVLYRDERLKLAVLDTFSPTSLTLLETDEKAQPNPRRASYPIFRTDEIQEAHRLLTSLGVNVGELITDQVVTYFTFYDLDDNILEVCQVHS